MEYAFRTEPSFAPDFNCSCLVQHGYGPQRKGEHRVHTHTRVGASPKRLCHDPPHDQESWSAPMVQIRPHSSAPVTRLPPPWPTASRTPMRIPHTHAHPHTPMRIPHPHAHPHTRLTDSWRRVGTVTRRAGTGGTASPTRRPPDATPARSLFLFPTTTLTLTRGHRLDPAPTPAVDPDPEQNAHRRLGCTTFIGTSPDSHGVDRFWPQLRRECLARGAHGAWEALTPR